MYSERRKLSLSSIKVLIELYTNHEFQKTNQLWGEEIFEFIFKRFFRLYFENKSVKKNEIF